MSFCFSLYWHLQWLCKSHGALAQSKTVEINYTHCKHSLHYYLFTGSKRPSSRKKLIGKIVKNTNFIRSWPLHMSLFNILCDREEKVLRSFFECCSVTVESSCVVFVGDVHWINPFSPTTTLFLKDTGGYAHPRSGYFQTVMKKVFGFKKNKTLFWASDKCKALKELWLDNSWYFWWYCRWD